MPEGSLNERSFYEGSLYEGDIVDSHHHASRAAGQDRPPRGGAGVIEQLDDVSASQPKHVAGVMRLTVGERQLARGTQRGCVNASHHRQDYRQITLSCHKFVCRGVARKL